jgi:Domain of unknown function (DUF397)
MTDYSPERAIAGDSDRVYLARRHWRKSSFSGSNGDCIEVASVAGGHVDVRDSKKTTGPCLVFPPYAWAAFLDDIRDVNQKGRNLIQLQPDGRLPTRARPARTIPTYEKQRSNEETNASPSRRRDALRQVIVRA